MKTKLMMVGGACIVFFIAASLNAQAPQVLNYQGKLTNNNDGTAAAGSFVMVFSIYSTKSGTTALWTETQQNVDVTKGAFNVLLGSVTPLVNRLTNKGLFAEAGERYLGIKVGADAEMTPRFQLTSVAYAIKSSQADKATNADTARVAQMALAGGRTIDGNSLDAADGDPKDVVFVDNNGNVGIGTTPDSRYTLDVKSKAIKLGLEGNGGGQLIIGHEPNDNKIYLEAVNTAGDGSASQLFLTGYSARNVPRLNLNADIIYLSDNVGIGTENPGGALHIQRPDDRGDAFIKLETTGTLTQRDQSIEFKDPGGSWLVGQRFQSTENYFGIGTTSQKNEFIISPSGNVGIGTTPNSFYTLDVKSKGIKLGLEGSGGGQLIIGNNRGDNKIFIEAYDSTGNDHASELLLTGRNSRQVPKLSLLADKTYIGGDVGIGTTTPAYKLDVNATSRFGGVIVGESDIRSDADILTLGGTTEDMRIMPNGNVGIGTTNPQFKLHVNGSVAGAGAYNALSDLRYKKNITPIPNAIDKITRLRGVSFDWRQEEFPELNFNPGRNLGFIAQEIKEVLPEVVSQDSKGYYSVAYSNVVPVLVEAMKEQQQTIAQLQTQLQQTEAEMASFKEKMSRIEASLQRLERLAAREENLNGRADLVEKQTTGNK